MQKLVRLFSTTSKSGKHYLDKKLQNATINIPKDEVGSLAKISNIFLEENVNLTYIKSIIDNSKSGDTITHFDVTFEKKGQNKIEDLKEKLGKYNMNKKVMDDRFRYHLDKIERQFNISQKILQLADLDAYVQSETGFRLKPSAGTINLRQYLNCLALKAFTCTQFLRHPAFPDYTPEPDYIHEFFGHIVVLANPSYAEFNHLMGLQSLGVSDQEVNHVGSLYMYTIEFDIVEKDGKRICYGGGPAGCVAEAQHFLSQKPKFQRLKPQRDSKQELVFHTVQPVYKTSDSLEAAIEQIRQFGRTLKKPFTTIYNNKTGEIEYDRSIEGIEVEENEKIQEKPK